MILVKIAIFSENKISLKNYIKVFNKISERKSLTFNFSFKILSKRKKRRIFTVLKSPHVNKIAQEQFQSNLFSKTIQFYVFQPLKLIFLLQKLQMGVFSDVRIKVYILSKTHDAGISLNNVLNPRLYGLKAFKDDKVSLTKAITNRVSKYCKLFDLLGYNELSFWAVKMNKRFLT